MNDHIIRADRLNKVYYGRNNAPIKALDAVSLVCEPGVFYALLGQNGAGKTTFLRMLVGLLRPTSGSVSLCGFDPKQDPELVRGIVGYISAGTGLYDRLSPNEILHYFGRLNGIGRDELLPRIDYLFEKLGIQDFRKRPCAELSTGMRQKVSLARAVVHNPRILLLDEPFDAVDVLARRAFIDLLKEQKAKGKTIICSSHRTEDIELICDHVLVLCQGKLIENAKISVLRQAYPARRLDDIFQNLIDKQKA